MRILIGTNNPGKSKEFRDWLLAEDFQTLTLKDLDIPSIEERGETFEENAEAKATSYAARTGYITVADDGGLEIDALDGAPGVHSRRWTGREDATDEELACAVIAHLRDVPTDLRTARLRTVVAAAYPDGRVFTSSASVEGTIETALDLSRLPSGYPYRALFRVTAFDALFSELTPAQRARMDYRRGALMRLVPKLKATEAITARAAAFQETR